MELRNSSTCWIQQKLKRGKTQNLFWIFSLCHFKCLFIWFFGTFCFHDCIWNCRFETSEQSRAAEQRDMERWVGRLPPQLKFWVLNQSNIQDIFVSIDFDERILHSRFSGNFSSCLVPSRPLKLWPSLVDIAVNYRLWRYPLWYF